ncbi:hypothetical protein Atai01_10630 [Amycolatopsis taiwanensis]|uniref:Uncharacterized protein n=1 Tax=Amycolatopsis taiwanensis TaxID=342230 RepID=A0A9W6QUK0_9PSEU|nr:hypothetical protein Atai01_10630 [Amycolatopsis taiwanensis]
MTLPVASRGNHGDHRARAFVPLSGRRGAHVVDLTRPSMQRFVDTVKGVWGLAPSRGCGGGAPARQSVWGLALRRGMGAEPPQDTVARKPAEERR